MTRSLILDDFASPSPAPGMPDEWSSPVDQKSVGDEDALVAFDKGYKSGWDDCAKAEAEERLSISADLAKNLSEAGLTYETARKDVLASLGPLFDELTAVLLPRIVAEAVAPSVLAEISDLAHEQTEKMVELRAAPSACATLQKFLEDRGVSELRIRPEPAFAEGQVSLRLGAEQRDIDMMAAADRIAAAINTFHDSLSADEHVDQAFTQGAA